MKKIIASFAVLVSMAACNNNDSAPDDSDGLAAFSGDSLAHHIAVLADDSLLGRKPFSEGEVKTLRYLEQEFKQVGLEPGNGSSYLQEVPMVRISTQADQQMEIKGVNKALNLEGFNDFVIWTDKTDSSISLKDAEIVFAGYGVVAPEYNWNDYAGLDVRGKVVMILVNDPGFNAGDTSLFKGKAMTYYGRWTYKFEEAGRQGAKGCLIVHETKAASYPFTVVQNNWNGSRLRLDNRGKKESLCDMIGWVSADAAKQILAAAGKDSTLLATADRRGFKGQPLGLQLSVNMKVKAEYNMSHNVIGKITGSKYPGETIIYTAHWDHLGVGKPDETGDSIYNGALDNASATAGLIELARAFKSMKQKPERTIVFLSVTAEEQGLWGSAYYAQNPVYPVKQTLANINMDGLNYYGKTKELIVVGRGQNDLEDILQEEAKKVGRDIAFETKPEGGSYY
ncbi:MAG: M20/M25/M40 family metallo-hydrolase, partial [Pedobacter sp.]